MVVIRRKVDERSTWMWEKRGFDLRNPLGREREGDERKRRKTYIHISSKDHNRPRIEFLRNNNLGIFSTLILSNPNFGSLNFDQFGGNSFEGRGWFLELRNVGLEGRSEEVWDFGSGEGDWFDWLLAILLSSYPWACSASWSGSNREKGLTPSSTLESWEGGMRYEHVSLVSNRMNSMNHNVLVVSFHYSLRLSLGGDGSS
jgi:hypothetical protein